jgi:Cu2+-exporting ATPase
MNAIHPEDADGTIVDPARYVRELDDGRRELNLMVSNVHCGNCIARIENALRSRPGVTGARVNLSTRRLRVDWRPGEADPRDLMKTVADLGFPVAPFEVEAASSAIAVEDRELLRCLAVAGFAAANVMLLSVSVWSGFADMGAATRDLFHWISALIAMPAVVYAGRPFFRSALSALKARRFNMDVPIALAITLSTGMSLFETIVGHEHAYFDASVTLLFFLLIGRYLDRRARAKARFAAEHLLSLSAMPATVVDAAGGRRLVPSADLVAGNRVFVASGDRIPADGRVLDRSIEVDTSLVTGETLPQRADAGATVFAGTLNVSAPALIEVTAAGPKTLLAEIVRLMEAAEQGRARYVRLADRVSRLYAPVVHLLALGTFAAWTLFGGLGWQEALLYAVSVLIITCPCALGLAVPAVQIAATGLLTRHGVLVKSPDGLEKLAAIDAIVFDKTGTLTTGHPELVNRASVAEPDLRAAASLAAMSRHPLSRAVVRAAGAGSVRPVQECREVPGCGLEGLLEGERLRLGSRSWCGVNESDCQGVRTAGPELWLSRPDRSTRAIRFEFDDALRSDVPSTVEHLQASGFHLELLSGDRCPVVERVSNLLHVDYWQSDRLPAEKVSRLKRLAEEGHKVLMVGDGVNDAPALAAGFVSMSPASASDISQTAADFVFQGEYLAPVEWTIRVARCAGRIVRQNIVLAIGYNFVAVPLAIMGHATPLVAALAMSLSSILVTANAFTLRQRI